MSTVRLLVTAAVVVLLAGCGSGTTSTAPAPADRSTVPAAPAAPLEGTWQTGPVSLDQTVATLRRHGLGRWAADYRRNAPFSGDTVLTLAVADGGWDLYGQSGDEPSQPIDHDADYEITGDTVTFHHSDGSTTHRWTVDGNRLRLELAGSTMPAYRGIPEEVFQRALYMTRPFTRQD